MIHYSQNDEQEIILREFKNKPRGTFLDIGANDGKTFSNTYALAKYLNWRGLLVEASPKAYERLLITYNDPQFNGREFDFANVAIAAEDGKMDFYESGEHLKKGDVGLLSTGKPYEMERWKGTEEFTKISVPCDSVETLLSRTRFGQFDLLSIDIEGMELEVLPYIPFEKLGIQVAVIEWNGNNGLEFHKIMRGYRLVHKNAENLIYSK